MKAVDAEKIDIVEGLKIQQITFLATEQDFELDLCRNDPTKIAKISTYREMVFGKKEQVVFKIHEERLMAEMRNEFKENKFEYMRSFSIRDNFNHIIKAAECIQDKPDRIDMKFETFDRKFTICFVDKSTFAKLCELT
jgi:hypothetical protein